MLTIELIREARERISPRVHQTPVITSRSFNKAAGVQVFFKCENLQRAGAFKIRGATNKILSLTPEEKERGVVAFSSGNHAQAVALAAREAGVSAVVAMPDDAPKSKIAGTRGYSAEIVFYDRTGGSRGVARDRRSELESWCRPMMTTWSWRARAPAHWNFWNRYRSWIRSSCLVVVVAFLPALARQRKMLSRVFVASQLSRKLAMTRGSRSSKASGFQFPTTNDADAAYNVRCLLFHSSAKRRRRLDGLRRGDY